MEIHKLEIRDSTVIEQPIQSTRVYKSYVVANPPPIDSMARIALRMAKAESGVYATQSIWIEHSFYRETSYTPRTFKETSERNGKIDAHGEDLLLDVQHIRSKTMDCWYVNIPHQPKPSPQSHCYYLDSTSKAAVYFGSKQ